jgi:hypothetical protein
MLASAPTWADTGDAFAPLPIPGSGGSGGVALAERDDDLAVFSDDDVDAWAASFVDAEALTPDEPPFPATATITETDEGSADPDVASLPGSGVSRAAGRTRAAAASARKTARRRGRARRRLVAGVCLPAVAIVAAMAYVHHPGGHTARNAVDSHAPSATLSAGHPSPSLGTWQHIANRTGDPAPLALSQLFPAQFMAGSASYARTTQLGSKDCASAVFGARLQAAVRKYGCSQVMRASYLSPGQKLMGTIGVLNLADSTGANAVGKVTGSSQFVAQLTAASGPTHDLTKGTGLEEAEVKGHYLILTWVEFSTLRAPKTASERAQLKTFSANLISRTANVSLTSRMVTGEPQVP